MLNSNKRGFLIGLVAFVVLAGSAISMAAVMGGGDPASDKVSTGAQGDETTTVSVDPEPESETGPETDEPTTTVSVEPADTYPPAIAVTEPADQSTTTKSPLRFAGIVDAGAAVTAGDVLIAIDADGNWSVELPLDVGANTIFFTATDIAGNQSQAGITVTFTPPPTTTVAPAYGTCTGTAGECGYNSCTTSGSGCSYNSCNETNCTVAFTAEQVYGSCSSDPPYDVFKGTTSPGATVNILSDFGQGMVVADGSGHWEVQVFFPSAPIGQAFQVKAYSSAGGSKYLTFIRNAAA